MVEFGFLFQVGQVGGAVDDGEPCLRDERRHEFGDRDRGELIVPADDDQHRPGCPGEELGVVGAFGAGPQCRGSALGGRLEHHGQDVAGHVLTMMLQTPAEGAAAALRARAERPDYTELLARTSGPVLVVVGRDDEFTPVAVAEFMATLIPQARLAVIDGAAHLPNLEQKAEFNHVLRHFLTDSAE